MATSKFKFLNIYFVLDCTETEYRNEKCFTRFEETFLKVLYKMQISSNVKKFFLYVYILYFSKINFHFFEKLRDSNN